MASNTPNLGLYKKNTAIDGNDTFNIETMLNQNWDIIDAELGGVLAGANDNAAAIALLASGVNDLAQEVATLQQTVAAHQADKAKYAVFTQSTAQSLANGTNTQILFQTKDSFNSEDFCLLESGRIKILQKGLYEFVVYATFAPNGTGNRFINNGFRIDGTPSHGASVQTLFATGWFKECNVDELVTVIVNQTSGGALDLVNSQVRVRQVAKL